MQKFQALYILIALTCLSAEVGQAQTPTRTATGGVDQQSITTNVDLNLQNDLQVFSEQVVVTESKITKYGAQVNDIIRRVKNLKPVIKRTRTVTVTRRISSGGSSGVQQYHGDGGGCG